MGSSNRAVQLQHLWSNTRLLASGGGLESACLISACDCSVTGSHIQPAAARVCVAHTYRVHGCHSSGGLSAEAGSLKTPIVFAIMYSPLRDG